MKKRLVLTSICIVSFFLYLRGVIKLVSFVFQEKNRACNQVGFPERRVPAAQIQVDKQLSLLILRSQDYFFYEKNGWIGLGSEFMGVTREPFSVKRLVLMRKDEYWLQEGGVGKGTWSIFSFFFCLVHDVYSRIRTRLILLFEKKTHDLGVILSKSAIE